MAYFINSIINIAVGVAEEGLVYAILAFGVYITYKILDFPDLSVDGTFPLGGAVAAVLLLKGFNPLLTLLFAFIAGMLAGTLTGLIHVKCKVRDLLSGIIMMTALYSVNLRIAGRNNVAIFDKETIFENGFLKKLLPESIKHYEAIKRYETLVILLIIALLMKLLLDFYLKTKSGYLLRAVGDNETLVTSLAKDKGSVKIIGLALANGFVALSGCIYTQKSGFFEISSGTGAIVIGLASVIIGINLFKRREKVKATTAVVIGTIIYKACVSAAIALGLSPKDMKLITAVLFLTILILSNIRKRKVNAHA
jgi:putative ABC transport system permease protein